MTTVWTVLVERASAEGNNARWSADSLPIQVDADDAPGAAYAARQQLQVPTKLSRLLVWPGRRMDGEPRIFRPSN